MSQGDMCPYCLSMGAVVIDSRPDEYGRRRRKQCSTCERRWSTHEINSELIQAMALLQERILQYSSVFAELQQLVELLRPSSKDKGDNRKDLLTELAAKYRENGMDDDEPPVKFIAEDNAFGKSLQSSYQQLLHQRNKAK